MVIFVGMLEIMMYVKGVFVWGDGDVFVFGVGVFGEVVGVVGGFWRCGIGVCVGYGSGCGGVLGGCVVLVG